MQGLKVLLNTFMRKKLLKIKVAVIIWFTVYIIIGKTTLFYCVCMIKLLYYKVNMGKYMSVVEWIFIEE